MYKERDNEELTRQAVAHFWRSGEQAAANQAARGKKIRGTALVQLPERTWMNKAGKIAAIRGGNEARIPRSEIERLVGKTDGRLLVLDGRVSGYGHKDDLDIQIQLLHAWTATERKGMETLAERRGRPLVMARTISGGSHSPTGSQTRMGLVSLFGTGMTHGLHPFHPCLALLTTNISFGSL